MGRRTEIGFVNYISIKGAAPIPTKELTPEQRREAECAIFDAKMKSQGYERVKKAVAAV